MLQKVILKAVITGDIIHSRNVDAKHWLSKLKQALILYGKEPGDWEIYRGDSFQLLIAPQDALKAAFILKATIKQIQKLDVRMGIGIGEVSFLADKITESNGSAFVNSGSCFDQIKKQTLGIKTPWNEFDNSLNLMLELATLTMDSWTEATSAIMSNKLLNQGINQKQLAKKLNKKSQGAISEGLNRGGYEEINKLLLFYEEKIKSLC